MDGTHVKYDTISEFEVPGQEIEIFALPIDVGKGFEPLMPFRIILVVHKQARVVEYATRVGSGDEFGAGSLRHRVER